MGLVCPPGGGPHSASNKAQSLCPVRKVCPCDLRGHMESTGQGSAVPGIMVRGSWSSGAPASPWQALVLKIHEYQFT